MLHEHVASALSCKEAYWDDNVKRKDATFQKSRIWISTASDMAPVKSDKRVSSNKKKNGRPPISKCEDLDSAIKYRAQTLREITNNLSRIHDLLLTEYQVRDINDKLNALLKERRAWEYKIKKLGGPDYLKVISNNLNAKDSITLNGYKYFGRAKELPDIMKLIEESKKISSLKQSTKNKEALLKKFNNTNNWPKSYTPKLTTTLKDPCDVNVSETSSVLSIDLSPDLVLSAEKMETFLFKLKKRYLLQKIRSQK